MYALNLMLASRRDTSSVYLYLVPHTRCDPTAFYRLAEGATGLLPTAKLPHPRLAQRRSPVAVTSQAMSR